VKTMVLAGRAVHPVQRVGLGIGCRRTFEQLTQPVEDTTVVY